MRVYLYMSDSESESVFKEGHCVLVELVLSIQGLGNRREREKCWLVCRASVHLLAWGIFSRGVASTPHILWECWLKEWLGRMRARGYKEW